MKVLNEEPNHKAFSSTRGYYYFRICLHSCIVEYINNWEELYWELNSETRFVTIVGHLSNFRKSEQS